MGKKKGKKGTGGLCRYLGKKHHWPKKKTDNCIKKASRGRKHRRRSRRKSMRYNPWAVCHNQGLRKGTKKFESCVQQVKAQNR